MAIILTPKVFATYSNNKEILTPKVFVTYTINESIDFDISADTNRNLTNDFDIAADTNRKLTNDFDISADTKRTIANDFDISADTERNLTNDFSVSGDTKRTIANNFDISADIKRTIEASFDIAADTERNLKQDFSISADTRRIVESSGIIPFEFSADTKRTIEANFDILGDTKRTIANNFDISGDTKRTIAAGFDILADTERNLTNDFSVSGDTKRTIANNFDISADTKRTIAASFDILGDTNRTIEASFNISADTNRTLSKAFFTISADTSRILTQDFSISADTVRTLADTFNITADTERNLKRTFSLTADLVRRIPYVIDSDNSSIVHSMTLTLAEKTLTDTLDAEFIADMDISDAIKSSILDYSFSFLVEETSKQYALQTIKSMTDIDKLLYTQFTYAPTSTATAKEQAESIAAALGKSLNISIEDFTPSTSVASSGATYQNILSSLFGWTSRLPHRQINVFLRGGTMYVLQRGYESSTIDITSSVHTMPTFDKKIIRTAKNSSSSSNSSVKGFVVEPVPFTGTISYGDQSVSYSNGLVISETHGNSSTSYSYSNGYMVHKTQTTTNDDGSSSIIDTDYDYNSTASSNVLLGMETETNVTTDSDGNTTTTIRITRHHAVGQGWYYTSVEEDGLMVGSSLSQGKSGGKASQYTIDQSNIALGSTTYAGSTDTSSNYFLVDTSFPVQNIDKFWTTLTNELLWLNRKTEETVTMTVYNLTSVIDFTQKIVYDGNTYYLQNNVIRKTPRELSQTVKLVRWY